MRRYVFFFIMIIVGAGVGLYYAWFVKPVNFVDASLVHLRQDYKTDYVLMAAEVFAKDQSVYNAMRRLDLLNEPSTEGAVFNAIDVARKFGYSQTDLDKMDALYFAISGRAPTATPVIDLTMAASFDLTKTPAATETIAVPRTPETDENGFIKVQMGVEGQAAEASTEVNGSEPALEFIEPELIDLELTPDPNEPEPFVLNIPHSNEIPSPSGGYPPILPPGVTEENQMQNAPGVMEENDFFEGGAGFTDKELEQLYQELGL